MNIRPFSVADTEAVVARGGPKISLLVRPGNAGVAAMYEKLGHHPDDVVRAGKRWIPDAPACPPA